MKHLKLSLILIIIIICLSCKDNNPVQENDYFKAKVIGTSVDCKTIYIIEFVDTTLLPDYIKNPKFGMYPEFWALNLPDSLKIRDLNIKIKCRELIEGEAPPCTFIGPTYRFIFINSAKRDE
ncbi:MAG: hypothetical protein EPN82_02060 [Bacteroidetes bacterium]|nr:MAG: hypothetical protein EPN82_02060 [Bacteroidota bacterium]